MSFSILISLRFVVTHKIWLSSGIQFLLMLENIMPLVFISREFLFHRDMLVFVKDACNQNYSTTKTM